MQELRILAVGNMYPPQHAGGYELAWQQAMRHAQAHSHRVRILTTDYREDPDRAEEDPDVHRTLRWYWDLGRYEFPRLNLYQRLRLELHNAAELRGHLAAFRPDVVAWWSMGCMSLSLIEQVRRVVGIASVFIVHDDWLVYGRELDQWIHAWTGRRRGRLAPVAERVCRVPTRVDLNRAGPFVFNSRYTLERARQVGIDGPAMTVVHPGIEERFLESLPPQPWRWRLVYVGRIDRQKGIDTAVAALVHLPEATLAVWGSGDDRYIAEMKALADRLGVAGRVRFEGFADRETLRSVYAGADVVVFPVRWNEPFGLVPLEAMGVGRPVVTTGRGGTAEFLRDGANALVFEADDAAALAACVNRLAGDEALRSRLREEGRRTAAQYPAARFAERTVDEILRVVEQPRIGSRPPVEA